MVNNLLTSTAGAGKPTTLGILTTTTPAPSVVEDDEVSGVIKIQEEFDQSLLDPTSDAYAKKVAEILALVSNILNKRSLSYDHMIKVL